MERAGAIASTIAEIRAAQPRRRPPRGRRRLGRRDRRRGGAAGALVARLPFNLGVGGAMRTGYRYAMREGYDVVVQIDADGQHDPRYLPRAVAGLDEADVVIGARFAGEGDLPRRGPRPLGDAAAGQGAVPARGHPAHRRHQRLPGRQPACGRGLRRPLPRRVPRRHRRVAGDRAAGGVHRAPSCPSTCVPARSARPASRPLRAAPYLVRAVVALGARPRAPVAGRHRDLGQEKS